MNLSLILITAVHLEELSFLFYSFCLFLERPGQQILYEHGQQSMAFGLWILSSSYCLYTFEGGQNQCSFLKSPGLLSQTSKLKTSAELLIGYWAFCLQFTSLTLAQIKDWEISSPWVVFDRSGLFSNNPTSRLCTVLWGTAVIFSLCIPMCS